MMRAGNTGREMVESGEWVKLGKKHYQHVSGVEITYDCNAWGWRISGGTEVYGLLWVALYNALRLVA